jgi:hypothetical protein
MNALRTGDRSRLRRGLLVSLLNAPPAGVARLAHALLTPEMSLCPLLRQTAEVVIQAEREVAASFHQTYLRQKRVQKESFFVPTKPECF